MSFFFDFFPASRGRKILALGQGADIEGRDRGIGCRPVVRLDKKFGRGEVVFWPKARKRKNKNPCPRSGQGFG